MSIGSILEDSTPEYHEVINYYQELASSFAKAGLFTYYKTDSGKPLHLFIITNDGVFEPGSICCSGKRIILLNNGIHPGEPCGINACMKIAHDILYNIGDLGLLLENTVICIIPIYNVGGALYRNNYSRVNQVGPSSYGFRANACNLDLNRDFIRCLSENAKVFTRIFHALQPDVFVDTHTSNGADHQYTITISPNQYDTLYPLLADYIHTKMLSFLFTEMAKGKYELSPHVHLVSNKPNYSIKALLDSPRYSSGYAALFGTISFMTEAHMLKPFKDRVLSTYELIKKIIGYTNYHSNEIKEIRSATLKGITEKSSFVLKWELDQTRVKKLLFKGYESSYEKSPIGDYKRMKYNKSKPFERVISFYKHYKPIVQVKKPTCYVFSQAWKPVIERMKMNKVEMFQFEQDTILEVEGYHIESIESHPNNQYPGHFPHYNINVFPENLRIQFYSGDYIIPVVQSTNNYIVQALEPHGVDSFFAWHFFDAILARHENFSPYLFEDEALKILDENPSLFTEFKHKQHIDVGFRRNQYAQLFWIYERSKYFDKKYKRYPVYRYTGSMEQLL